MGDNNLSAVQVAELFFKHVVCRFGVPDEIISDRGCRFVSTNANTQKPAFEQSYLDNVVFPIDLAIATDTTHPQSADFATKVRNLVHEAEA